MAKINSGILGGFSGKLSTVQGYRRNGQNIIQSQPLKKNIPINSTLLSNSQNLKKFWTLHRYFKGLFDAALATHWPDISYNPGNYLQYGLGIVWTYAVRKSGPVIILPEGYSFVQWSASGLNDTNASMTLTIQNLNKLRNQHGTIYRTRVAGNGRQGINTNSVAIASGNQNSISTNPGQNANNISELELLQIHTLNKSFQSPIFVLYQKKNATP